MNCLENIKKNLSKFSPLPPKHYISDLFAYFDKLCDLNISINAVILYGSLVKGTYKTLYSDVDLIVVFDELPSTYHERIVFKRNHLKEIPSGIQATWFTKKEFKENFEGRAGYLLDSLYEGWVLIDKSGIILQHKEELQRMLNDGKIIRENNHWEWPMKKLGIIQL